MKRKIHPVDTYVGQRLKSRRRLIGASQYELGSLVGVSFQQIQKYEKGYNRIGSSRLYEFSKILNVPISYFLEGYEESRTGDNKTINKINNKEVEILIKNFLKIKNKSLRDIMIRNVRFFAKVVVVDDDKENKK